MKVLNEFDEKLLENGDKFQDEFFKRFNLRHAPKPIRLTETIAKDYFFPTFYSDVTCAIGIFMCSYEKALKIMPHPKVKPVKMPKGRAVVAISCYEYKNVMGVPSYNEIAMTMPVMVDPKINIPLLPMAMDKFSGYYVFSMPVTSLENRIRGNTIWGLPKVVQEIDISEKDGDCIVSCKEETGETYFELKVPMGGTPAEFDVKSYLYSRLGNDFLKSETNFKGKFNVTKYNNLLFKKDVKPDTAYLKLGDNPCGRKLKELEIEEHPFQLRFAKHMNSCFDLADPNYKSPIIFV